MRGDGGNSILARMQRDAVEFDAEGGALEPKRLGLIPGGHFGPYLSSFIQPSGAEVAWFREHLS
jgi:hypothetical protein